MSAYRYCLGLTAAVLCCAALGGCKKVGGEVGLTNPTVTPINPVAPPEEPPAAVPVNWKVARAGDNQGGSVTSVSLTDTKVVKDGVGGDVVRTTAIGGSVKVRGGFNAIE